MSQRQITKHEIVKTAHVLCNLMAIPNHSQHLAKFASLNVFSLHGKYPTAFWDILGHALPLEFHEGALHNIEDWAALVRIIALAQAAQPIPTGTSQSFGSALQMAGMSRIRLLSLIGVPTREDFRLQLVRCVGELTRARLAFPIGEVAELLLLDGADREQAHNKLATDCAI